MFTAAAFEDGVATRGIVALDLRTGVREVFGGVIPALLVSHWQSEGAMQVIAQAEASALEKPPGDLYIDNESTRYAVIRGSSPCKIVMRIVAEFLGCKLQNNCVPWIERVPSASNVADLPTQDGCAAAAELVKGRVVDYSREALALAESLTRSLDLPWDLLSMHCKSRLPAFKEG